jgi:hypothetical protein
MPNDSSIVLFNATVLDRIVWHAFWDIMQSKAIHAEANIHQVEQNIVCA